MAAIDGNLLERLNELAGAVQVGDKLARRIADVSDELVES